jgi:hypothetical protein
MTHPQKPLKQYDEEDWREYYGKPENFDAIFTDYERLYQSENRSTSQDAQMQVLVDVISGLIG